MASSSAFFFAASASASAIFFAFSFRSVFRMIRRAKKMQNAMIRKSTIACRNSPYCTEIFAVTSFPAASVTASRMTHSHSLMLTPLVA